MVVEKNLTNAIEKYGPSTRAAEHIKKLRDKKKVPTASADIVLWEMCSKKLLNALTALADS